MTRAEWSMLGTCEVLLGLACVRAWQLWTDRTNALDSLPAERVRPLPAVAFGTFAWLGLLMLALAFAEPAVLALAVLAIPLMRVIKRPPERLVPPHLRRGARRPDPVVVDTLLLERPDADRRLRDLRVLLPLVVALGVCAATVPAFGPWPLLAGLLGLAGAAGSGAWRVPALVLTPDDVEIRNWRERRTYAWRDVRGLAVVRLAPTRPPIVALQLRTGALRRVEALRALGSVEQKGLARSLKREGITPT